MMGSQSQDIQQEVDKLDWVHAIDLGGGVSTPGRWGRGNPVIWTAFDEIDFVGKKVLDIGCWDGAYSFAAEKRGASEVWATDLVSQRDFSGQPTFQLAKRVLGSSANYEPHISVYDIESLGQTAFDVVLFMGVYYHLKDPLFALSRLRRVMKEGAILLIEGAIVEKPGCYADFYYRKPFCGDHSNWWVPTVDCLKQWVECNFFEITHEFGRWGHLENQRHTMLARAVVRKDELYSRSDPALAQFSR